MCVNYTIGEDLPKKLEVMGLDPVTREQTKEEVLVSYPAKPLMCTGCKTLGHVVGACPLVKRHWVRKDPQKTPVTEVPLVEMQDATVKVNAKTDSIGKESANTDSPVKPQLAEDENEHEWQTVLDIMRWFHDGEHDDMFWNFIMFARNLGVFEA
ncbi:hypothetical protein POM88_045170 [Heracleum sosnowskyi]|uniref:Uncharacterized protein n=1 Tax=Heracleum sosnowskyi TaxID=360622 RepID=A0AAD8H5G3_9APIA|nr:hypothetical protein POM88_045170 [Heracleum sosnowskyi]